jgi:hypothetical protein
MPATRSLKPLLKFTLLLCLIVVLYRSFLEPRLNSPSRKAPTTYIVPGHGNEVKKGGGGVTWGREIDTSGGNSDEEGIAIGFKPPPNLKQDDFDRPKNLPPKKVPTRQQFEEQREEIKQKVKVEQIVEQVPKVVPEWVVEKEIGRVEDNGERVPVKGKKKDKEIKVEDNLKKELERMRERKQQKEGGRPQKGGNDEVYREGEGELPSRTRPEDAEPVARKVYHLVDEDDELDAAQRGDGDARVALAVQRKKGPLIQVGGAGNAAGEKAAAGAGAVAGAAGAAAADAVKAKGKDKWKGKGWDQRFKKQGGEEKKEDEGAEGTGESESGSDGTGKAADS